jgi:hypothetical protein
MARLFDVGNAKISTIERPVATMHGSELSPDA